MTGQHVVVSPEKIVLSYNLATIGSRISAKLIDLFILYLLLVGIMMTVASFERFLPSSSEWFLPLVGVLTTFLIFLYFGLSELFWNGQTVGKKAVSIRVVMVDGTPISPLAAFYRNTVLVADLALPFIGLTAMFLGERAQRVGDLAAGTLVVHEPKAKLHLRPAPHRYGIHPFEEHIGPLRGMTLEEYLAIKRLCDRFPELPLAVQTRSIEEIWVPFAKRFKIPSIPDTHPIFLMEATVMKYGRMKKLL